MLTAVSQPFPASPAHPHTAPTSRGAKFPSPLFFNFSQALASATASATYLIISGWRSGDLRREGIFGVLGLKRLLATTPATKAATDGEVAKANGKANGSSNGHAVAARPWYQTLPGLLLQVSLFQTTAGPIGFHALKHISYPTMVLAKVSTAIKPRDKLTTVLQAHPRATPQRPAVPPQVWCAQVLGRRARVGRYLDVHAVRREEEGQWRRQHVRPAAPPCQVSRPRPAPLTPASSSTASPTRHRTRSSPCTRATPGNR